MAVSFRIGVLQLSMEPVHETLAMARACEAAGFDTFWLAEAYPWWRKHSMEARSSTAITALVAQETKRIGVGWGIISPYTRHPVQIAMEARVMQEVAGDGRFLLGLGVSKIFMKEIGEGEKGKGAGPATVMKECVEIVRAMLEGKEVNYEGRVFSAHAPALRQDAHVPRGRVPFYIGATGPVLQRMAGELTDGLLTASITTPGFVRYARQRMEEGARKAGRDPEQLDLGSVIVGSIGKNPAAAKEGAPAFARRRRRPIGREADLAERAAIPVAAARRATEDVINENKYVTYDLGGSASLSQMADQVASRAGKLLKK